MPKNTIYLDIIYLPPILHVTPAHSSLSQLWTPLPLCGQSNTDVSVPVHSKLSRTYSPEPDPKYELLYAVTAEAYLMEIQYKQIL